MRKITGFLVPSFNRRLCPLTPHSHPFVNMASNSFHFKAHKIIENDGTIEVPFVCTIHRIPQTNNTRGLIQDLTPISKIFHYQVSLASCIRSDQLRQLGHEQRHLLGSRDDVVVLARPLLHLLVQVVGGHLSK